ncbi:MAG: hypothetical protein ABIO86_08170 [Sphingomonas sp.]
MTGPSPAHCRLIVPLLCSRDGRRTDVLLSGNRTLPVFNIAWGEDMGDEFEHLTSNNSPFVDGADADLFFTDEVVRVVDPETGVTMWETDGVPNLR